MTPEIYEKLSALEACQAQADAICKIIEEARSVKESDANVESILKSTTSLTATLQIYHSLVRRCATTKTKATTISDNIKTTVADAVPKFKAKYNVATEANRMYEIEKTEMASQMFNLISNVLSNPADVEPPGKMKARLMKVITRCRQLASYSSTPDDDKHNLGLAEAMIQVTTGAHIIDKCTAAPRNFKDVFAVLPLCAKPLGAVMDAASKLDTSRDEATSRWRWVIGSAEIPDCLVQFHSYISMKHDIAKTFLQEAHGLLQAELEPQLDLFEKELVKFEKDTGTNAAKGFKDKVDSTVCVAQDVLDALGLMSDILTRAKSALDRHPADKNTWTHFCKECQTKRNDNETETYRCCFLLSGTTSARWSGV